MAKAVVTDLAQVPEALRPEYEQQGSVWVLKLEGDTATHPVLAPLVAKVDEFRSNNVALLKERDTLKANLAGFEGVDPTEYKTLKAQAAELKGKGVHKAEDIATIVATQVAAALAPVTKELETIRTEKAQATQALARKELESTIQGAALRQGVDERALPDVLYRASQVFTYKDGQVVAERDGAPVFSKARPGTPLTPDEFLGGLAQEAPHLFKPSKGSGAPGGAGAPAAGSVRWISNDPVEMAKNAEGIAKGEVRVRVAE